MLLLVGDAAQRAEDTLTLRRRQTAFGARLGGDKADLDEERA